MRQIQRDFLIGYDIAQPARLRRVHRLLKARGHPLLESLFVFRGTLDQAEILRQQLLSLANPREDLLLCHTLAPGVALERWGTACQHEGVFDFSLPSILEDRSGTTPMVDSEDFDIA